MVSQYGTYKHGRDTFKTYLNKDNEERIISYRQGDVFIMELEDHAFGSTASEGPQLVLALGETTGHSHTIDAPVGKAGQATILREAIAAAIMEEHGEIPAQDKEQFKIVGIAGEPQYFELKEPMTLVHDEHDPVDIPAGKYKSIIQRQYMPEKIERVYD
jgi:hypothetical protein